MRIIPSRGNVSLLFHLFDRSRNKFHYGDKLPRRKEHIRIISVIFAGIDVRFIIEIIFVVVNDKSFIGPSWKLQDNVEYRM